MASSASTRARKNRIRPVSRETRFLRLRSLKCFEDVHTRLLDGFAVSAVADFIQLERKEYTDVGRPSLETILTEYRASLPAAEAVKKLPHFFAKAVQTVSEGIDELAEMEKLYRMQLDRVAIDLKTEQNIGKLLPTMTQEMRAAREILSDIAQLKMDLGVNTRHLGKMEVEAQIVADVASKYDNTVTAVMQNPESRRKLLGIADRFLSLAAGDTDTTTDDSDVGEAKVEPAVEVEASAEVEP